MIPRRGDELIQSDLDPLVRDEGAGVGERQGHGACTRIGAEAADRESAGAGGGPAQDSVPALVPGLPVPKVDAGQGDRRAVQAAPVQLGRARIGLRRGRVRGRGEQHGGREQAPQPAGRGSVAPRGPAGARTAAHYYPPPPPHKT